MIRKTMKHFALAGLLAGSLLMVNSAGLTIAADYPHPSTLTTPTPHAFDALLKRLEKAITDNGMGLVAQASASRGACPSDSAITAWSRS